MSNIKICNGKLIAKNINFQGELYKYVYLQRTKRYYTYKFVNERADNRGYDISMFETCWDKGHLFFFGRGSELDLLKIIYETGQLKDKLLLNYFEKEIKG